MPQGLKLCYITDRKALAPRPLLPAIEAAIRGGVDLVQFREKDLGARELIELVKPAMELARGTATRIVVNARLDVALALGAHGVHLGAQSIPAAEVRRQVPPDFLVGVSCHSSDEALAAEAARADYILLGPIFETPSKLAYGPPLGLKCLREVTGRVKIPVLALGGITLERVKPCLAAGATGIAGISIFQAAETMESLLRQLRAQFT